MKKVGVWVLVAALFLALAVGVQAQTTCDMPCTAQTESTDCRIDQFCNTSGCCELIPCTTNEDCPFACPTTSSVFNVAALCNMCVDGLCHDPCTDSSDCPGPGGGEQPQKTICGDNNGELCETGGHQDNTCNCRDCIDQQDGCENECINFGVPCTCDDGALCLPALH